MSTSTIFRQRLNQRSIDTIERLSKELNLQKSQVMELAVEMLNKIENLKSEAIKENLSQLEEIFNEVKSDPASLNFKDEEFDAWWMENKGKIRS
jgi:hypothetical protein